MEDHKQALMDVLSDIVKIEVEIRSIEERLAYLKMDIESILDKEGK